MRRQIQLRSAIFGETWLVFRLQDCKERFSPQQFQRLAKVIDQVLIAVFDGAGGVRAPNLLWNGFGQQAQLAFAFLNFQIGLLQLGSSLADPSLRGGRGLRE